MNNNIYIGLMSGTSIDSIDAAAVYFDEGEFKLLGSYVQNIPKPVKQAILNLCQPGTDSVKLYAETDHQLGQLFATAALALMAELSLSKADIAAIGSHGQTVRHAPPADGSIAFSLQIADPNIIAARTGCHVVADFRRADMAVGGHGAPLVPAFHQQLFSDPAYNRAIVNIGGIANITILPASDSNADQNCIGYDTGPGNMLLDSWSQIHLNSPYDSNGDWGAGGTVNSQLLTQLKCHDFFAQPAPKSTGREMFNQQWLDQQLQTFKQVEAQDVQATLVQLTAETIADQINALEIEIDQVYICGGGAFNAALMNALAKALPHARLATTMTLGLEPCWVEACAFAWLARQRIEGKHGNLPTVTGARKRAILGGIYPP
ncbi:anhydro-N-acetylmuramic acid kinase [Porticoccaceae bacterium]|nr:anhydro-N-acetylmuramic acid kinase [Porticoccaceae bacterium]MDC0640977.1 anhydro-N-acetylmuramic acid kinase [Porticoccaceae bacterium]